MLPDPQSGRQGAQGGRWERRGRAGVSSNQRRQATVTTARAQQARDCVLTGGRGSQGCSAVEGAPLNSEEPAVGQQRPGRGAARSTSFGLRCSDAGLGFRQEKGGRGVLKRLPFQTGGEH